VEESYSGHVDGSASFVVGSVTCWLLLLLQGALTAAEATGQQLDNGLKYKFFIM
jgi:hypothetical protein